MSQLHLRRIEARRHQRCSSLSSLVSELCSLFPAAGLDVTRVSLKCRLPGNHPDAVFDVPDEYALRIAIFGSHRSAKKLPGLLRKSGRRLLFFLTVNSPLPEPVPSSSPSDEEPPVINLSSPTPTNETKPDDLLPEVLRLIEELKDGVVSFGKSVAVQTPGSVRNNWPPPPPFRWLKSGRSKGNGKCLTWPGGAVTRVLCDRTGREVGHCTLDSTWQPKGVLVMGP